MVCEDCQSPYDTDSIECRLVEIIGKKSVLTISTTRFVRSTSNGQVSTRALSREKQLGKSFSNNSLLSLHTMQKCVLLVWVKMAAWWCH